MAAQDKKDDKHHHYKLIDFGTFGGPSSYLATTNEVTSPGAINQVLNNQGIVVGWRDTSTLQQPVGSLGCFNFDCFLPLAFQWQKGVLTDLGVLPGGDAGAAFWISDRLIAEQATNGVVDPLLPDFLETRAVLWKDGKAIDLGTLGGKESGALSVNDRGQVAGTSDLSGDLATHPFLWTKPGPMRDLGTFGGSFGIAEGINDSGEVVGVATNDNDQALLAFLWKDGVMTNLGTLNGDDCSQAFHINSKGQIVGISFSCAGGPAHGFLWQNGFMTDLNALLPPGSSLTPWGDGAFINDRGEIAGVRVLPNGDLHAFLLIPCGEGGEGCANAPVDPTIVGTSQPASGEVPKPMTAEELAAFKKRIARMSSRNRLLQAPKH